MDELLEALIGKEIERTEELASGSVKVIFTDGTFIIMMFVADSTEIGEVADAPEDEAEEEEEEEEEAEEEETDSPDDGDDGDDGDENKTKALELLKLDDDADDEEFVEALNGAKKKVIGKIIEAMDYDLDDFDDKDEMIETILDELGMDESGWDD